jgi:hypothetical protein
VVVVVSCVGVVCVNDSAVRYPMVVKWSLSVLAMSCGLVKVSLL